MEIFWLYMLLVTQKDTSNWFAHCCCCNSNCGGAIIRISEDLVLKFIISFVSVKDKSLEYCIWVFYQNCIRTYAKKPGFYSKSLFLTDKYLRETGFLSLPT